MNTTPEQPETGTPAPRRTPYPKRFEASRLVLWTDAFMNRFIKVGGLLVVVAVIGIFVFIMSQVLPMFQSAKVDVDGSDATSAKLPEGEYVAIAVDEWGSGPSRFDRTG